VLVKNIIDDLQEKIGRTNAIQMKDILKACEVENIANDEAREIIQKLKRSGEIFEPRNEFIQKL
jgi:DNA replicative helicase MCM subunit Mcm2 (Cdc46/Mcm family)